MTKILLVEDDKSLREIYGVRLLAEGYDIVSAGDGEEALAMAIKEKPTLIISDVMMPKISGFDMLDILRSTTETRDIKVIMMTALSSDDQRSRGEQLGADKYLVKSQVGIEDVVRTVHEVLGDAPGITSTPAVAATAVAVADPTPATDTATPAAPTDDTAVTPVEPVAEPTPAEADQPASGTEPQADTAVAEPAAAPGNEGAGPLPPQPTETTLPQPTAPFASPRPATLGERVIQPLEPVVDPLSAEAIAQELQAAAEPVNTQVDETATTDADSGVVSEAAAAPEEATTDPFAPIVPGNSVDLDAAPATEPATDPAVTFVPPTDASATPADPSAPANNDQPAAPAA